MLPPAGTPTPRRRARILRATTSAAALSLGLGVLAGVLGTTAASANPAGPDDPIGAVTSVTTLAPTTTPTAGTHTAKTGNTAKRKATPPASTIEVTGWAADPDDLTADATVLGLVDGKPAITVVTSVANPKIAKKHATGPTPGFVLDVPVPAGNHTLCVAVRNTGKGINTVLDCVATPLGSTLTSAQTAAHSPAGAITDFSATGTALTVAGWSTDPDEFARQVVVVLYVDGVSAATVNTARFAPDVTRPSGAGYRGAFDITVPVSAGAHIGCIWAVNVGLGANASLGCQSVDTRGESTATTPVTEPTTNAKALREAGKHLGQPYVWGAEGPKKFDCSGLVQYSYGKAGVTTPRVAQDQFHYAHLIPASRAVPGDLVFYHDSEGAVYHVGIYTGPGMTIAAVDPAEGVTHQTIYTTTGATYGSFTHT